MANRYFVNGGVDNNWSTIGNWSLTSGGAGGQAVPLNSDDVFLDGNSPACTVNASNRVCRQFDATGYTNTLTMTFNITATPQTTGVFKFGAGMAFAGSGTINLTVASSGSCTITTAGLAVTVPVTVSGSGSTLTLADNWDMDALLTIGGASTVTINGNQINIGGSLTVTGTSGKGGTTNFVVDGTGTWTGAGGGSGTLTSNLEINTAGTFTLSSASVINYSTGTLTYTAGTVVTTGSTINLNAATTLDCAGITWNNFTVGTGGAGVTFTLSDDLNVGGNFTCSHSGSSTNTFNGNTFNISGGLSVTGGHLAAGTTLFKLIGTGTLATTGSSTIRANLTIDTAGTITLSATVNYHTNTFTYTAGTLAGASTPILNINSGTATVMDWGGADLGPWTLQINTAGVILNLASGLVIPSTASLTLIGTAASVAGIRSSSSPTQRALTIEAGATIDVIYCNFTDIDASGGDVLWVVKGTRSNTANISPITPYTSPLGVFVGGAPFAVGSFG